MSTGNIIKSTRDDLKNVITNGCKLPLSNLTDACMIVIEIPPITIKHIAFNRWLLIELPEEGPIN